MPLKFFLVPVADSNGAELELNAFLVRHRVLSVDRRWVDQGRDSFWAVCVDFLDGSKVDGKPPATGRSRIDYKQVLSTEEFAIYSRLRDLRKEIAQAEAVPVYAVLTNEQLALAVQQRCRTLADLRTIEGLGEARVEKYGQRLLEILVELPESQNEADGQPV